MKRTISVSKFLVQVLLCIVALPGNLLSQQGKGFLIKGGWGQSVSSTHFFRNANELNRPVSGTFTVELGYAPRRPSFYFGLELQALNYYPTETEKLNLSKISLKFAKTSVVSVGNGSFEFTFQRGILLGSFIQATSSKFGDSIIYKGGPFDDLHLGGYLSFQMYSLNRRVDVGIAPELSLFGLQVIGRKSSPYYLRNNYHFQSSINFLTRFKF